jgi:hypothetical protein
MVNVPNSLAKQLTLQRLSHSATSSFQLNQMFTKKSSWLLRPKKHGKNRLNRALWKRINPKNLQPHLIGMAIAFSHRESAARPSRARAGAAQCVEPHGEKRRRGESGEAVIKELEQAIKRRIEHRTGGRIQMLEVEVVGDRVIVRGRASCYYLKQLALRGVLDVIDVAGAMRIELNVNVVGSPSKSEPEGL